MKISTGQVILGSQQSSSRQRIQQVQSENVRIDTGSLQASPTQTTQTDLSQLALTQTDQMAAFRAQTQQAASLSRTTQLDSGEQVLLSHFNLLESVSAAAMEQGVRLTAMRASPSDANANTGSNTNVSNANAQINQITINNRSLIERTDRLTTEALGSVLTEDGRQIDFILQLDFERSEIIEQQTNLQARNMRMTDPLVINLNGNAPALSNATFEFDLDMDGNTETLSQTASGTGFIAFDKNQNGQVDNGAELFGPQTGSGFGELAQYDEDGNGWIDENDSIYAQLSFVDFNSDGSQRMRSLQDVEIGAIYLGSTGSQWDMEDSEGNFQAQMQRSGVALREDGQVLAVQEIYYASELAAHNNNGFEVSQATSTNMENALSWQTQNLDRLDQLSDDVRQQFNASFNRWEGSMAVEGNDIAYTPPAQVDHLRWLDESDWLQNNDTAEAKLEYLRDMVQDLRDQQQRKLRNEEKLTTYQTVGQAQ